MDFFEAVKAANREIAALIRKGMAYELYHKGEVGAGGDMSAGIDLEAEAIFLKYLTPFGQVHSEECGLVGEGDDLIIIDPIDGSDNLLSHMPYFGTSVARRSGGVVTDGIIVNLANDDLFVKNSEGFFRGKLHEDELGHVIKNPHAKVGLFERAYRSASLVDVLKKGGLKFRAPGAVALSLAYAHDVSFVLYEGELRSFDIEAGWFMCQDLNALKSDKLLLVSKDKEIFDKMSQIVITR